MVMSLNFLLLASFSSLFKEEPLVKLTISCFYHICVVADTICLWKSKQNSGILVRTVGYEIQVAKNKNSPLCCWDVKL